MKELFDFMGKETGVRPPHLKISQGFARTFAKINEAMIGLLGLRGKIRPIVASEMVRYFQLGCRYDGTRARRELGINPQPVDAALRESIAWYIRNGYVKKSVCRKYEARKKKRST